jgi:hypothetical protein
MVGTMLPVLRVGLHRTCCTHLGATKGSVMRSIVLTLFCFLVCFSMQTAPAAEPLLAQPAPARHVLPPMYYETGRPLFTNVSYTSGAGDCGGGCGTSPSCCEHEHTCHDHLWDDYCSSRRTCRPHAMAILHRHRGCYPCVTSSCATGCGGDMAAGGCSSCGGGCESGCATGCANHTNHGCDACHAYDTVGLGCDTCCRGQRWGFRGCLNCCQPCYKPHCKPIRCWANGWCGELVDGYSTGHPVCPTPQAPCHDCQLGTPVEGASPMPTPEAAPAPGEPLPMPEAASARASRFAPVSVRVSRSAGIK